MLSAVNRFYINLNRVHTMGHALYIHQLFKRMALTFVHPYITINVHPIMKEGYDAKNRKTNR